MTEPKQGQRLRLTIDSDLQKIGERALAQAIQNSEYETRAGAFVAMDPRNGEILAMGSAPSFDASWFAKPFTQQRYEYLTSNETDAPLLNRATESAYPTGVDVQADDGDGGPRGRADHAVAQDRRPRALGVRRPRLPERQGSACSARSTSARRSRSPRTSSSSSSARRPTTKGRVIQRWAEQFGYGSKTGIDLPNERPASCRTASGASRATRSTSSASRRPGCSRRPPRRCSRAAGSSASWTGGDNVNLAVGQGDLQATPLQVAVAYAALENSGTVVRPHLGKAIEDGNGVAMQEFRPKARRKIKMAERDRDAVLDGLRRAAQGEGGTSADVFTGWPMERVPDLRQDRHRERQPNPDQAWYAAFVPDKARPIVVVVTVEKGGFGAATAAPAARMILSEWFDVSDRDFHAGTSVTR